jgi:hypothetical protein
MYIVQSSYWETKECYILKEEKIKIATNSS